MPSSSVYMRVLREARDNGDASSTKFAGAIVDLCERVAKQHADLRKDKLGSLVQSIFHDEALAPIAMLDASSERECRLVEVVNDIKREYVKARNELLKTVEEGWRKAPHARRTDKSDPEEVESAYPVRRVAGLPNGIRGPRDLDTFIVQHRANDNRVPA
jgi:hypothetical protein